MHHFLQRPFDIKEGKKKKKKKELNIEAAIRYLIEEDVFRLMWEHYRL